MTAQESNSIESSMSKHHTYRMRCCQELGHTML